MGMSCLKVFPFQRILLTYWENLVFQSCQIQFSIESLKESFRMILFTRWMELDISSPQTCCAPLFSPSSPDPCWYYHYDDPDLGDEEVMTQISGLSGLWPPCLVVTSSSGISWLNIYVHCVVILITHHSLRVTTIRHGAMAHGHGVLNKPKTSLWLWRILIWINIYELQFNLFFTVTARQPSNSVWSKIIAFEDFRQDSINIR